LPSSRSISIPPEDYLAAVPRRRILASLAGVVVLGAAFCAPAAATTSSVAATNSRAAVPTVTGPVTGGQGINLLSTSFDLAQFGYVAEEFFISGDATAYTAAAPLAPDGKWRAEPSGTAPFTTRMVVYRPAAAKDFDGTAVVEWLNVSAGFDNAVHWSFAHLVMLREGMAWVGVSAQAVGVQGGQSTVGGVAPGGIKGGDPARYGSLTHPGDSYSYDMFTQAARAVRGEGDVKPLGDLKVKRVIGVGDSQGASRMVTYVNAVQPVARAYDGFLIQSRYGGGAPLTQAPLPVVATPVDSVIRNDLHVPVLVFQTETDVGPRGSVVNRQPDTKRFRLWEVAGTAHGDAYTGQLAFGDVGDGAAERKLLDVTNLSRGALNCTTPVNAGPHYAVVMAALWHLERWVRDGSAPPHSPRLAIEPQPLSPSTTAPLTGPSVFAAGPPFVLQRDEHGNAIGGIRTPLVDVPRATLTGEVNSGGAFCSVFGTSAAFDAATVASLYPTQQTFLAEFRRSLATARKQGFLLPEEAEKMKTAIAEVPYPG